MFYPRHIVSIACYYGVVHVPYLTPDTESPSLAIMGTHMCRILSQTQSHHRLLLWGPTCAVSYPRHRVTIACYYGVTHVPYFIPDTESPSLIIMGSHMCHILSQTQSQHRLLLWGHKCAISYPRHIVTIPCYYGVTHVPYLIPDTESPSLAIMGTHMCRILSQTQSKHC